MTRAFLVVVVSTATGGLGAIDSVYTFRADAEARARDLSTHLAPTERAEVVERAVLDKSLDATMADLYD